MMSGAHSTHEGSKICFTRTYVGVERKIILKWNLEKRQTAMSQLMNSADVCSSFTSVTALNTMNRHEIKTKLSHRSTDSQAET